MKTSKFIYSFSAFPHSYPCPEHLNVLNDIIGKERLCDLRAYIIVHMEYIYSF
jgi:hypothetical protein